MYMYVCMLYLNDRGGNKGGGVDDLFQTRDATPTGMYVCMYVSIYICMYACMYVYVCKLVCIFTVYVWMYVCTYTLNYVLNGYKYVYMNVSM